MTCSTCPLDQGPYTVVGSLLLCSRCSSVLEAFLSNSVSVACHAAGDVTAAAASSAPSPEAAAVTTQSRAKATEGKAGMAGGTPTVRQTTAGTGLRVGVSGAVLTATSEFMDVTAGRDRQPISSSGDGLGIHEPGSITWGDREAMPAPSGRARDRAECPAVTGDRSCGDHESRVVAVPLEIPTQRSGASRDPLDDGSVKVGPHREDAAGVAPGPQEALSDSSQRSVLACTGQAAVTRSPANGGGDDEVTGSDCRTHSGEGVVTSRAASSLCNADGLDIPSFLDRRNATASRTFAASEIASAETSSSNVRA